MTEHNEALGIINHVNGRYEAQLERLLDLGV